jgi:hypothetical protein
LISCDLYGGIELDHVGVCGLAVEIRAIDKLVAGAVEEDEDLFGVGARWEVGSLGELAVDRRYWILRSRRHLFTFGIEMSDSMGTGKELDPSDQWRSRVS